MALVITPNLPEAAALLDAPMARSEGEMREQAERLLKLGPQAVLIKGGHDTGAESVDLLVEPTAVTRLAADRILTQNTHGTGCTLSSAIAAGLAKGLALAEAVRAAKAYVTDALVAGAASQDRLRPRAGAPFSRLVVMLPQANTTRTEPTTREPIRRRR